jgi:hypothetical protein
VQPVCIHNDGHEFLTEGVLYMKYSHTKLGYSGTSCVRGTQAGDRILKCVL